MSEIANCPCGLVPSASKPTLTRAQVGTNQHDVPGRFYSLVHCKCGLELAGPNHDDDCSQVVAKWNALFGDGDYVSVLRLVARIREAIGDNGRLMQDELVERCRALAEDSALLNLARDSVVVYRGVNAHGDRSDVYQGDDAALNALAERIGQ